MPAVEMDNEEVITRAHAKIHDSAYRVTKLAGNEQRQHGYDSYVLGYLEALKAENLISQDSYVQLVSEHKQAFKLASQLSPDAAGTPGALLQ
ncbi:hypothetical protein HV782_013955 [Pseudomonas monsensis]|uniref:hypothetical protein n=1 Tax=Pseudomonas monsensis TaxID=2745509 RepID=UPI0016486F1F|nr:hypothetical protein [Pseudomonas monsensis]QXI03026.1 hypothetical protein HV782_013955 [Pseudomonas monsensis]